MTNTTLLAIPELPAGAKSPEVIENEKTRRLEVYMTGTALAKDQNAPAGGESNGDAYIIGATPSGAFATFTAGNIAARINGAWVELAVPSNFHRRIYSIADSAFYIRVAGAWVAAPTGDFAVQDDSVEVLASAAVLNFTGSGVVVTDGGGGIANVAITASAVASVNGATGTVVLDADDIDDASTTNKFATAAELTKLAGIEAGADVTDEVNVTAALDGATLTEKTTPVSGDQFLMLDSAAAGELKWVDSDNLTGGGSLSVEENGTEKLPAATVLNFIGATVTDAGSGQADITVPTGSGARAKLTSAKTAQNYTTATAISWDAADFDDASWWAGGNPTRLTAPSGFSRGTLHAYIKVSSGTADEWIEVTIRKNGATIVAGERVEVGATDAKIAVSTGEISFSATDYFEVLVQTESDTSVDLDIESGFSVVVAGGGGGGGGVDWEAARIYHVGAAPGMYSTIAAAVAASAADSPTSANRHVVLIHPGTYTMTSAITTHSWLTIKGVSKGSVRLSNVTTNMFEVGGDFVWFEDFLIDNNGGSGLYAFDGNDYHAIHVRRVDMLNNGGAARGKFLLQEGANWSVLFIEDCIVDYYDTSGYAVFLDNTGAAARFVDCVINNVFSDAYQLTNYGGSFRIAGCQDVRIRNSTIRGAATYNTGVRVETSGVTGTPTVHIRHSFLEGGVPVYGEASTNYKLINTDAAGALTDGTRTLRNSSVT